MPGTIPHLFAAAWSWVVAWADTLIVSRAWIVSSCFIAVPMGVWRHTPAVWLGLEVVPDSRKIWNDGD